MRAILKEITQLSLFCDISHKSNKKYVIPVDDMDCVAVRMILYILTGQPRLPCFITQKLKESFCRRDSRLLYR